MSQTALRRESPAYYLPSVRRHLPFLIIALSVLLTRTVAAQTPARPAARAMVVVRVHSAQTPVSSAGISLLSLPDSTLLRRVVTDSTGRGALVDVGPGRYRIRTEIVGYETDSRDIRISNANA